MQSTHRNISSEYIIKKRWLRGERSDFAHLGQSTHTKISGVYAIKKRCLRGILSPYLVQSTHRKINDEDVFKKSWLRGQLSHFAHAGRLTHKKISGVYVIKKR